MHFYLSARPAPGFPPCRVHSYFPLKESCSTQLHFGVSDSLRPRGPEPARLLCPWDLPIKTTGVACHARLKTLCVVHLLSGFPGGLDGKESTCNAGDPGSIPGPRRYPGEGNGNPLQYSHGQRILAGYCPWGRKELDTTEWLALTYFSHQDFPGGAVVRRRCGFDPWVRDGGGSGGHSSILAWEIPWTEKPGGLQYSLWLGLQTSVVRLIEVFAFWL